jgi:hypothetical protein
MSGIQKLKAVRAVVRPDKRGDYLDKAAEGMEGKLEAAFREAGVKRVCVRREGDEALYREVIFGNR